MTSSLRFHVSHVRVEVRSELPEVIDTLARVWACCARPLRAPTRDVRFEVRAHADGYAVIDALGLQHVTAERADALPLLEAALYRAIPSWHAEQVLLHAACVGARGGGTAVLLGRSGAGKSSLALCALRAGFSYFSDELTATDGTALWGVPRAVQFEPVAAGAQPAPWARDTDVTRYPLQLADGQPGAVPLWFPDPACVPLAPVSVSEAHVVAIARGDGNRIEPLAPVGALAVLHEAAHRPPRVDLGRLVGQGRCFELTWRDPARAIELLAAVLAP